MAKQQKKDITELDGNNFQYKVKKALTDSGWNTRMSPYYNDSFSEKPREIDIIAEKAFPQIDTSFYTGTVIVRLFIECKYISKQTTFWFDKRNLERAKKIVERMRAFHEPNKNYEVLQKHHYLFDSLIAKLWETEGKNPEGDPFYKAMNQSLNATIYFRQHSTDLRKDYNHQSVVELNYPVIMCNSFEKLIKKDTTTDSVSCQIVEPFQLEVDYAYTQKDSQLEELFYVDILNLDSLKDFEDKILLDEINLAKQKISDDKREASFRKMQSGQNDFDPYGIL